MKKQIVLSWDIYNNEIDKEERYCHNCGKKVIFEDSLKRRQNANGKNIFHYAIYKCPKGHTWNKMLGTFKATSGLENIQEEFYLQENKCDELFIAELIKVGVNEINILINVLQKKERIDKFLSSRIKDFSRTELGRLINEGFIKVNGETAKGKTVLNEKDVITMAIEFFK